VMRSDGSAAAADMAAARVLLDELRTLSADPATRRFGRLVRGMDRPVRRAQAAVDNPRIREGRKIQMVKAAYARGMKALAALGSPVLAETKARSAGFHKPGQEVTFRVLGPDGGPCNETPTVTVDNQYASSAVDLTT